MKTHYYKRTNLYEEYGKYIKNMFLNNAFKNCTSLKIWDDVR